MNHPAAPSEHPVESPSAVAWGMREVGIAVVIVLVVIVLVLAAAVLPVFAAFGEDSTAGRLATALSTVVAEVIAAVLVYRLLLAPRGVRGEHLGMRLPIRDSDTGRRGFSFAWLALIAAGTMVSFLILFSYVALVELLDAKPLEPPEEQIPGELFSHWLVIVALGISVLAAAPLFEELFFRGFAFAAIRKTAGAIPAAIGSGLLFGLAHFDVGFIIPFAGIGAWFAFLYWRTDSLYTSMSCHFIFNLLGFAALVAREA